MPSKAVMPVLSSEEAAALLTGMDVRPRSRATPDVRQFSNNFSA
jgi:hypothetical protein